MRETNLSEIGLDERLWRWTTSRIATPEDMRRYVRNRRKLAGAEDCSAVRHLWSGVPAKRWEAHASRPSTA